jgi:hypothetical protein
MVNIGDGGGVAPARDVQPRVIAAADVDKVMVEQLQYTIDHYAGGDCGCSVCNQYWRVRRILLDKFRIT